MKGFDPCANLLTSTSQSERSGGLNLAHYSDNGNDNNRNGDDGDDDQDYDKCANSYIIKNNLEILKMVRLESSKTSLKRASKPRATRILVRINRVNYFHKTVLSIFSKNLRSKRRG